MPTRGWISKFLSLYEEYTCLWDRNDPEYKKIAKRERSKQELMKVMKLKNVQDIEYKLSRVRNRYNTVRRMYDCIKEMNPNSNYTPKQAWYPLADRIFGDGNPGKRHVSVGNTISRCTSSQDHIKSRNDNESHESSGSDFEHFPQNTSSAPTNITDASKMNAKNNTKTVMHFQTKHRNSFQTTLAVKSSSSTGSIQQRTSALHDFSIFGKYIACQLKRLPLETALELLYDIQSLVLQTRIKDVQISKSVY